MSLTPEQLTVLFGVVIAFLQAVTAAIVIWNNQRTKAIQTEQKRVSNNLDQVQADGRELRAFLSKNADRTSGGQS